MEALFNPSGITTTKTSAATTWRPCGWSPLPSCLLVMETWFLTPTVAAASASSLGLWWDIVDIFSLTIGGKFGRIKCPFVTLAGSRLHRPGGGGGRQEAGAEPSREARSQLHDGLPHLQEGNPSSYCINVCMAWNRYNKIQHIQTTKNTGNWMNIYHQILNLINYEECGFSLML